ncbi:MAG TPA: fibronectin type III domain-containing protein [Candidatus Baltobacteraceae bacterium]|nr:fibronectin type III domain-containing protein [Candidatus Baltobacteraceae bacterium]
MENRSGTPFRRQIRPAQSVPIFNFLFSIFLFAAGCGAPGEPQPPTPPVPQGIADLAAKQAGDGVLLTFTMPGKSTLGDRLQQVPTFEVLRGSLRPDGTPDPKSFRVVDTVPGALVARYSQRGQVQFIDPVAPTDPQFRSGQLFVYRVHTLFSAKHPSPDSKDITLQLYPVAERLSALDSAVTEQGIELKWVAPSHTSTGEPLASVQEYHVYRGELDPTSSSAAAGDPLQAKWKSPLLQLGATGTTDYRDSGFDYGKTYAYLVRTVIASPAGALESSDSPMAIVTPKDTFPPAAPQNVVAAIQPGATPGSVGVELSWSINVESDLAGYRVYRSQQDGDRGALLTPELLPSPAYRDNSAQSGQRYWYTVTAVDRSGNESGPSLAVAVDVAQPSR